MSGQQYGQRVAWSGVGEQHVDTTRLGALAGKLEAAEDYARKSRTHLWIVTVLHQASEKLLDKHDGNPTDGPPILDQDTMLLAPMVGCFVCEQAYSPRLRRRRCPGGRR